MKRRRLLISGVLLVTIGSVSAAVHYVDANSASPTPPYTSWATAAATIQDGVDAAAPGDEIVVTNGVYATGGRAVGTNVLANRVAVDKPLVLWSVNGPEFTIIQGARASGAGVQDEAGNGEGAIRCAYLASGAVLSGFTLTNGATRLMTGDGNRDREESGGGVWCAATSATLTNCVLIGNSAASLGGGAFGGALDNCTLTGNWAASYGGGAHSSTLNNCTLTANSAGYSGGGVAGEFTKPPSRLRNCVLNGNHSGAFGGGASYSSLDNCVLTGNSTRWSGGGAEGCTLRNCTVTGNRAGGGLFGVRGGGVSGSTLFNCSLTGNSADEGGGAYGSQSEPCALHNCIVYFNHAPTGANYSGDSIRFEYSCTSPLPLGSGNIAVDPQLVSATHLSPTSPCVGAGHSAHAMGVDIDGEPWLTPPAMGADQPGPATGPLRLWIDADVTTVATGYGISFTAQNSGPVLQSVWDFGDGTMLTNQPFATHSWIAPGVYTVHLTGYSDAHPGGITATVAVTVSEIMRYYVNAASPNPVFPYGSWATAATNIQDAIGAGTLPGRVVLVTNGVYQIGPVQGEREPSGVVLTNAVVVRSVNGPAMTVIQGAKSDPETWGESYARCAYVGDGSVLSGFTLTQGWAMFGGGVWCETFGVVTNCVLTRNSAEVGGGALGGTLYNCTLTGNVAVGGGFFDGIGGGAYSSALYNCVLNANSAAYMGGGVYQATLHNCTLTGNRSSRFGGGAYGGALHNCIVYSNRAPEGPNYSEDSLRVDYSCTTPLPPGTGNIDADPRFVDADAADFRLRPDSPCIDAGSDAYAHGPTDLDGQPRIVRRTVDIGAYEFQSPAPGSWTRKANMPMALDAHASCEVDGILYVIGGHEKPLVYTQLPTLFAYDPKTDSWGRKKDMPTARRWPAACVVDGIIYVIGGGGMFSQDLNAVEAYDPRTDTWSSKAPLATARSGVLLGAVDGIIYAIGGTTGTVGNLQVLTTVEAYDPKTDQWTPRTRMPLRAAWGAASVVNGLVYAFFDKDTAAYDPKTDRWTRKASIPSSSLRCLMASISAADGLVYLFGGEISSSAGSYDLSLAYDPVHDKFAAKRKMPMKCEAAAAATIDGKIYHTGGASGDPGGYPGAVYYDSLWVFDPQGGVAPQILSLNRESADRVRLTWQGEAGRLYGVKSTVNLANPYSWTRVNFSTGANSVRATNELVEATGIVPSGDTQRFFRVLEAD